MHRSRSREKPRADFDPSSTTEGKPAAAEGYNHPRNYIKASRMQLDSDFSYGPPTEANSITFDFKSSTSKKKTKAPLRAPMAEQKSTEIQIKRSSPTVIAKLMGLDTLPSPLPLKPPKEAKNCSPKLSSKDILEKPARDDRSLTKSNDSQLEFKDVFEVVELPKAEKHENHNIRKQRPNKKPSETGMAFIRQSFINAKRLSTDEMLQRSKEFDNALEVLESNKDLFLKLLQEPHSLFSKHFQDLCHPPPSPHLSHALIQESSRSSLSTSCESSLRSEIKDKRYVHQISGSQPLKKPAANSKNHPFRESKCSPEKLSGKDHAQPTEIVILKPGIAKARKAEQTVGSLKTSDNHMYGAINHRELPREEITRRMAYASKYSNYVEDDGLWPKPSISNNSDIVYEYRKSFSPSSSSFIESSANLKAGKDLSDQRRLNHHEEGLLMRTSSTLGEILALSDNETTNRARNTSFVKKVHPFSISSKDRWKDGFFRDLPSSKSLPASSLVYENCLHNSRNRFVSGKSRFMPKNSSLKSLPDGRGNRLPVREVHVSSEDFKHKSYVVSAAKEKQTARNLSDNCSVGVEDFLPVHSSNIAVPSLLMKGKVSEKLPRVTRSEMNGKHSEFGFGDMHSKQGQSNVGIDELLPFYCNKSVSVSPDMYKEADQPSPVSVLELSSKESETISESFKKISADLQELRTQLQFLSLDSTNGFTEEIEAFISFDDDSVEPLGDILQAFRDEEERDYSYLLDMLIDSGILKYDKIKLFGVAELPVSVNVFSRLEKKYKSVESWPRSERKFLFDLINSTLSEISAMYFMNIWPWIKPSFCWKSKMAHEGLVEEIWQSVVRCRKEISSSFSEENLIGLSWSDGVNGSEVVATELENMLFETLLDQLVKELMYM
ncbi:uncharacterized protein LOC110028076 isoform X2 [Phalaenopsis equestris]|uniref:uncharacterized protein LOC110028076 isoform X2 n=1 Tax=Phalaenopsis equestris TaxID=78828 RepID=UPI0009E2CBB3|nr:uncharacterized protein LOC110028076 isoform X2 [Phalaenopsis equestris]